MSNRHRRGTSPKYSNTVQLTHPIRRGITETKEHLTVVIHVVTLPRRLFVAAELGVGSPRRPTSVRIRVVEGLLSGVRSGQRRLRPR